jgi:16S rRNA (guanine966-N2)-methyltransferase
MNSLNSKKSSYNKVRLIAGVWRSRVITFPDSPGLRPTSDRIRETLFNWLQQKLPGAKCLDLYAGSGALTFEALSRGAAHVVALECEHSAAKSITENAKKLLSMEETDRLELLHCRAEAWLTQTINLRFDIVFIDPPFAAELHTSTLQHLIDSRCLSNGALIYLEAPQPLSSLGFPFGYTLLKEKRAGTVYYGLLEHTTTV